jgi:hypothetical protein
MTLQQALPGLQSQPGGAIVAIADSLFDIFVRWCRISGQGDKLIPT